MQMTSKGQKATALVLFASALVLGVGCLGSGSGTVVPAETAVAAPPETAVPSPAATVPSTLPTAAPRPDESDDLEELEEHGTAQDPDVLLTGDGQEASQAVQTAAPRNRSYSEQAYSDTVDKIVGKLSADDMTALQKCQAVYNYVKGHVSYTGSSDKSDWKKGAYSGFTTGRGDCFTYYACSRALLTALGIENQEVQRSGSELPTRHYWNLVNCGEGWYHFDACPHLKTDPHFVCFMATDQDLLNFDVSAGRGYYSFDADAYPERVGGRADPDAVVLMPKNTVPTPEPMPSEPVLPLEELVPPAEDPLAVSPAPDAEAPVFQEELPSADPSSVEPSFEAPPADPEVLSSEVLSSEGPFSEELFPEGPSPVEPSFEEPFFEEPSFEELSFEEPDPALSPQGAESVFAPDPAEVEPLPAPSFAEPGPDNEPALPPDDLAEPVAP